MVRAWVRAWVRARTMAAARSAQKAADWMARGVGMRKSPQAKLPKRWTRATPQWMRKATMAPGMAARVGEMRSASRVRSAAAPEISSQSREVEVASRSCVSLAAHQG